MNTSINDTFQDTLIKVNQIFNYRTGGNSLVNWPRDESQIWNQLFDPITRRKNNYIHIENAHGQLVYNTFSYGCADMVVNTDSEDTLLVNIGCDNIGNNASQVVGIGGSIVVINSMRYNGSSYDHKSGHMELYNRITINDKDEQTMIETK